MQFPGILKPLLVMKLCVLFVLAACLQANAHTWAQGERVTLAERNVPVRTILQDLHRQAGYVYLFNREWEAQTQKVTIVVKDAPIETVLDACFRDQPFTYAIVNKTIIIKQKQPGAVDDGTSQAATDQGPVTGRIVGEKGEPLEGVSVLVRGTAKVTTTNSKGEFTLASVSESDKLLITIVGYEPQEVRLNGKSMVTIRMKVKASQLGDVAVIYSSGYQNISKERATGAYDFVDNAAFNRETGPSVINRLEGTTTGMYFNKAQGATQDFSIRGLSSLSSTQPLIVVDNFIYKGDLNNLNPNDIQSVTVLKDAASASIWGAQSGNGVIVITTKKGGYNQPLAISLNTNFSVQNKPDLYYNRNFLDANDFINTEQYLFNQGFYNSTLTSKKYPLVSPVIQLLNDAKKGVITQDQATAEINALRDLDIRPQEEKYLYQKPVTQQYALSFSGGSNNIDYILGLGYDRVPSTVIGNSMERETVHSLANFKPIGKKLEIQAGFDYYNQYTISDGLTSLTPSGGKAGYYPYAQLVDAKGNPLSLPKVYNDRFIDTAGAGGLLDWTYTPLNDRNTYHLTNQLRDIKIVLGAKYNFSSSLSAEVHYQNETQIGDGRNYYSQQSFYARNLINQYTQYGSGGLVNAIPVGGILNTSETNLVSDQVRGQVNFFHQWNGRHEVSAIAGGEINQDRTTSNSSGVYGYNDHQTYGLVDYTTFFHSFDNVASSAYIPNSFGFSDKMNRFVSTYANAAYTYSTKYTFEVSGRRDASNLFGVSTNNKWTPLWSSGLSWKASREKFYHVSWLPVLTFRASYGYNGNVNNSVSALSAIYYTSGSPYTNFNYASVTSAANPDLKWETIGTLNLGLDFRTKGNRLYGKVDYFRKNTNNLIALTAIDPTEGLDAITGSTIYENSASLTGKGLEIDLTVKEIDGGKTGFNWYSNILFTYVTNRVTKYFSSVTNPSSYVGTGYGITPIAGKDPHALISYRWGGLDSAGNPIGYLKGKQSQAYSSITSQATWNDLMVSGTTRPPYFGFFTNTFTWRGFELSARIAYEFGFVFRKTSINYYNLFNVWQGNVDFAKRWQKPGDEKLTNVPSMTYPANSYRDQVYNNSTATVDKGDLIRLQDITFAYRPPQFKLGNYAFKGIRLYATFQNIGLIWRANKDHIDPDYGQGLPTPLICTGGLNVNF
jgi:TonB-linked SusC/RagA family outer membrane protein